MVATAGTALTEYQLKALSRLAGDVRLVFDADRAGLAATERAIPIASKVKISLSVITILAGKDPDELIKKTRRCGPRPLKARVCARLAHGALCGPTGLNERPGQASV